jgi:hypothetical protein
MKAFGCALAAVLISFAPVEAADKIWSAVLVANNVPNPKPAPVEIKAIAPRLQRVFGYNQFEIVGKDTGDIADGAKASLTPTKTFWLELQARRASIKEARGGYLLNLQLYQDSRALVDTVALIAPHSPLFFRGPLCSRGQVIVVLQVQP